MINCPFSKKASTRTIIKTYGMCVMCTLMTHWNTIFIKQPLIKMAVYSSHTINGMDLMFYVIVRRRNAMYII